MKNEVSIDLFATDDRSAMPLLLSKYPINMLASELPWSEFGAMLLCMVLLALNSNPPAVSLGWK
jgi:hypothetical protein